MTQRLTDHILKAECLPPAKGNKVYYDSEVRGLGLRVTAAGATSFVFNYHINGRERRYTIGPYGRDQWTLAAARKRAGELRRVVDNGEDPLGKRVDARTAPTVADMCRRFEEEHLPKLRLSSRREYKAVIDTYVLPALKHHKVAAVESSDIDDLHRKISKTAPYRANRTVAVLSKMFSLATRWWPKLNIVHPVKGIERNVEVKRKRYLTMAEIAALVKALAEYREDRQAADIFLLLLLTGARIGEVRAMRWRYFGAEGEGTWAGVDLEARTWKKPGATTKQKTWHEVPLSGPALQLLTALRAKAEDDAEVAGKEISPYVFPGRRGGHRVEAKGHWAKICKAAGIVTTLKVTTKDGRERTVTRHSARPHDLRHTHASVMASSGKSLLLIGAALGHTQAATTARYAHLFQDPLREAAEQVGAVVTGRPSAEISSVKERA